jgi:UDP-glucose 4-epimerase
MDKYLITGNAGLLGSNLADYILNNKMGVVYGVDDLSGGYESNVHADVKFHQTNILDVSFDEIFEEIKPDYVFHLAAYAAEGLSPFIREYNYQNNLIATTKIVNNCIRHNVKRLVFTSTLAVYGNNPVPYEESMIPNPIDPYGVAKQACETDIEIAGEQHGLDWCIIRPHNVYGKKQNIWDKYRNVLGIWMYQHMNGEPLSIFGDGEQSRAFSCIDDIVRPLHNAAHYDKASKQKINLGGVKVLSINRAADALISVMGGGEKIYFEKRHEIKESHPTWRKSIDLLDFQHTIEIEDGLRDMWNWAKSQPQRSRMVWTNYELDKGIYSYWKNKNES